MQTAQEIGFERYGDFRPTAFDGHCPVEGREDWAVAPVGRNRDSGCWHESNFDQFLEGLGGEGDHVEVHRFGHWGPGWFEIILFDPDCKQVAEAAYDMARALQDYPILDESDLSRREWDDYQECWDNFGRCDFQRAMERELNGFRCHAVAALVDDLDSEQVDEIWQALRDQLNWEYDHNGDECIINIDGAVRRLSRDNYAEIARRYK